MDRVVADLKWEKSDIRSWVEKHLADEKGERYCDYVTAVAVLTRTLVVKTSFLVLRRRRPSRKLQERATLCRNIVVGCLCVTPK